MPLITCNIQLNSVTVMPAGCKAWKELGINTKWCLSLLILMNGAPFEVIEGTSICSDYHFILAGLL